MNRYACIVGMLLSLPYLSARPVMAQLPAFPGAQGFGAYASGGRGGEVYHVTKLTDDGTSGTLRHAISSASSARTIVFDVGGTIELLARLDMSRWNMTFAGQTAPGGGITVKGGQFSPRNNYNTIIRHMRFRLGDQAGTYDAFWLFNVNTAIVDHVSASWGMDECLSVTGTSMNVTVQDCIISEGLNANNHGYGSLIAPEAISSKITFHHNLYAHQLGRMPRAGSRNNQEFTFDFRNNIVYNWGNGGDWGGWGCIGAEEKLDTNYVANYAIAGPNTVRAWPWEPAVYDYIMSSESAATRIYQSGNKIDSDRDNVLDGADTGWSMFRGTKTQMSEAFSIPFANSVTTQTADQAYLTVLADAGATPWNRDAVDARIVTSVQNHAGSIINSQADVGGWPDLGEVHRPAGFDTDADGMPNYWETWYGTNSAVADQNGLGLYGYTHLERYLQWLIDPPSVTHVADYNNDGAVNVGDLGILAGAWGQTGSYDLWGDLNGSGTVDVGDLGILAGQWGWTTSGPPVPPANVPEPAGLALLGLGAMAVRRRR